MENSSLLKLPYILPAQAQKHVTHNEALRKLDAIVHLSVISRNLQEPPTASLANVRFIVADNPAGEWKGHASNIAAFQDGAWEFYTPQTGWLCWLENENSVLAWDGESWISTNESTSLGSIARFGINTSSDDTNRLSVKTDAILFSHDDMTPGSGDLRQTLNKSDADKTASLIFQSGFQGHAEFGLAGTNNFKINVSADGANWFPAMEIDNTNGAIAISHMAPSSMVRSDRDENGIFRRIENMRTNGSLASRSELSGGTSPEYATRIVTVFDQSGDNIIATQTYTLSYSDGEITREVLQ